MMIQKVGNRYSLLNMLNGNLTKGLTGKMQKSDAEYYLQALALKSGVSYTATFDVKQIPG